MRIGALSVILALLAPLLAETAAARTYRNDNYGIVIDVPDKYFMCGPKESGDAGDHGFSLFLDEHPKDCEDFDNRRHIAVFGIFNAMDESDVFDFARADPSARARVYPAPKDLRMGDKPTAFYRIDRPDGKVEFQFYAEGPAPFRVKQYAKEPWVFYGVTLLTEKEYLDEDMATLRVILPKLRFFRTK